MTADAKAEAKDALKRLLIEHKGDGKHEKVKEALDNLIELATKERGDGEWEPAQDMELNLGRWRSVTDHPFPGKLPDHGDGKTRWTLGRMSFGMFAPTKAVCVIEDIINVVEPVGEKEEGDDENAASWKCTYTNDVSIVIETPTVNIPTKLVNNGVCYPQSSIRMGVEFSSGTLQPAFDMSKPENESLAAAWKEMFDGAIAKEAEQKSYLAAIGSWAIGKMLHMMMGLEPPVDTSEFTQTYQIRRPYVGWVDTLYIDHNLRVTRGNKGTLVVVERVE